MAAGSNLPLPLIFPPGDATKIDPVVRTKRRRKVNGPTGKRRAPAREETDTSSSLLPFPREASEAEPRALETLGDLMERLADPESLPATLSAKDRKQHLSVARTIAKCLTDLLRRAERRIKLEELVRIDWRLFGYLTKCGFDSRDARYYLRWKDKLIRLAQQLGWSSTILTSWEPIRDALGSTPKGGLGIIASALQQGIPASQFGENGMRRWRREMHRRERAPLTIQTVEANFRSKIRNAKLEHIVPLLDLAPRCASRYGKPAEQMSLLLTADIDAKVNWKSEEVVEGRDASLAIRPASAKELRQIFRQVCGYAEQVLGRPEVHSLREVLVPQVLCPMAEWLIRARRNDPSQVEKKLWYLHGLLTHHPDYKQNQDGSPADYSWLRRKIKCLPHEPRWELGERKNAKSVRWEKLAEVSDRIEQALAKTTNKNERARLKHDLLFFRWTLYHPWRSRNLRECGLHAPARVNLTDGELPIDLQGSLELSAWAKGRLKKVPTAPFVRFGFVERETKAGHRVEGLVAKELVKLYREYTKTHRGKLFGNHADPGTLFLNRKGNAMTARDLSNLYAGLTQKYIDRRVTPHLNRDSFAAHHLENGGTMIQLQKALWHRDIQTTWGYCRRFNASHGAVVLERHLATIHLHP